MAMIVSGKHLILDHVFEPFEVNDKAGDRIWIAGNRDFESVVVPMSVAAGSTANNLLVFFLRPGYVPVVVRC